MKGVELTEVGTTLLAHVQRLQLARDDLAREIANFGKGQTGHIRIGINPGLSEEIMGMALGELFKRSSKVTLSIGMVNPGTLVQALRDGKFDLAIFLTQINLSEAFVHEALVHDEFVVYASSNHPLAKRKRVTPADLVGEQWVASPDGSAYSWQSLLRAFERHSLPPPGIAFESASSITRYHAVASTYLLGFQSRRVLQMAARRFRLVDLQVPELTWQGHSGIYYRRGSYLSPAARQFIEILKSTSKELADAGE